MSRPAGFKHTEETKRKMSKAQKGKVQAHTIGNTYGKGNSFYHTEEAKRKISKAAMGNQRTLGYKHTEESKRKMSENNAMKRPEVRAKLSKTCMGRRLSKEIRKKISVSIKRHTNKPEIRKQHSLAISKAIKEGRFHPESHCISGEFYSKKNKKSLHYRSQLELNWYKVLEKQTKVKKYQVEPCIIPYEFEGSTHHYLPDLRIVYTDGSSELVEIKPESEFNDPKNQAKWIVATEWCSKRKRPIGFKVVEYEELN